MPEYLAPGVFIEELGRTVRPIEGVGTSTAAFLGETVRGPMRPTLVTRISEFHRHFGGELSDNKFLPFAVRGFFENGGRRAYVCRIAGSGAATAARSAAGLRIEAIGPGDWGNRVHVKLSEATPPGDSARFRLQIAYWEVPLPGDQYADPFDPGQPPGQPPSLIEDFDNLAWDDPTSPDYFLEKLKGSALVRGSRPDPGQPGARPIAAFAALTGGADGTTPTAEHFHGNNADVALRSGLAALELDDYREVSLVAAPGGSDEVADALRAHCEHMRFRFAVVDCPKGQANAAALDPRTKWDTSYAAFYYPWIYIADPQSGARRLVPPSGHLLGIYSRTDDLRGVWKAPANEIVRGALDLEYSVETPAQDLLNPRGVNVIRQFPARGIRVWGARTLSSNALWKYISVRRLFIYLEQSILQGMQWVVFEPNDARLWGAVRDSVRLFLRTVWRDGGLMGLTEDEAFFIRCDSSTMTNDDIANGRLICEIGVAPVRPAEFVILRIHQFTAEAQN